MVVDEIRRRKDEHLAHDVRPLLVPAHEADHAPLGRVLYHALEALSHQLLELHPLADHGSLAAALKQRLLDREKPPRSRHTTASSM